MYLLSVICYHLMRLIRKGCNVVVENVGEWVGKCGVRKDVSEFFVCMGVLVVVHAVLACCMLWSPLIVTWLIGPKYHILWSLFPISTTFTKLSFYHFEKISNYRNRAVLGRTWKSTLTPEEMSMIWEPLKRSHLPPAHCLFWPT